MKQTAADWLIEQIKLHQDKGLHVTDELNKIFSFSKEIEKNQMMGAYGQGMEDYAGKPVEYELDFNQYYKETYGT